MKQTAFRAIAIGALLAFMLALAIGAFGNCNLGLGHPSDDGLPAAAAREHSAG